MAFADTILADLTTMQGEGGSVTRHKRDGTTATFTYILFGEAFEAVSPNTMAVEMTDPQLVCLSSDVADPDKASEVLTINGTDYRILGVEPAGTGLKRLQLSIHKSR